MTRRPLQLVLASLLLAVACATPVAAGNWATAEMDQPAPATLAHVETMFRFVILQHGETPASWVTARFVATNLETGEQIQAPMRAVDADGHFRTSLTFPRGGDWTWFVSLAELGTDQDGAGGTLTVLEPGVVAARVLAVGSRFGAALGALPALARVLAARTGRSAGPG
jgi:hypothetical protein